MILQVSKRAAGASAVVGCVLMAAAVAAGAADAPAGDIEAGKAVANDRAKGNCVACHMIPGAPSPGTIGPALVAMKARYPDSGKLHAQIYDSTVANPESAMPPFGRNRLLTEKELNDVTAYIGSL
jgi:sulfur-oxidizing protein SoxX